MIDCNGRCKGTSRRYKKGAKRCNACEKFFMTDDIFCGCCGQRLRSKSRNSKYRKFESN